MEKQRAFKLTLAYKGTKYCGWQKQAAEKTVPSVQETLEQAAEKVLTHKNFSLHGSGRTDSGVHARGQVAHLKTTTELPAETMMKALNAYLPEDIRVLSSEERASNFHAQLHVTQKTYRYFILQSTEKSYQTNWPFLRAYTWFIPHELDVPTMKNALADLLGEHDFKSFQNTGTIVPDTVREILEAQLIVHEKTSTDLPWMPPQNLPYRLLEIRITGTGFLKQMVRTIVGTLVDMGRGKIPNANMQKILSEKNRSKSGITAPARALFLDHVVYDTNRDR